MGDPGARVTRYRCRRAVLDRARTGRFAQSSPGRLLAGRCTSGESDHAGARRLSWSAVSVRVADVRSAPTGWSAVSVRVADV